MKKFKNGQVTRQFFILFYTHDLPDTGPAYAYYFTIFKQ